MSESQLKFLFRFLSVALLVWCVIAAWDTENEPWVIGLGLAGVGFAVLSKGD